eukprot:m.26767 g.26767  ORF g.26767 m.26767 type:complete len:328 (+) comp11709_c0_seq1:27-1010(+)
MIELTNLKEFEKEHLIVHQSAIVKLQLQLASLDPSADWAALNTDQSQQDFNLALLDVLDHPTSIVEKGGILLYPHLEEWNMPGIVFGKGRERYPCSGHKLTVTVRVLTRGDINADKERMQTQRLAFKARHKQKDSDPKHVAPRAAGGIRRKAGARPLEELKEELRQQVKATQAKQDKGKRGKTGSKDDDDDDDMQVENRAKSARQARADNDEEKLETQEKAQPIKQPKMIIDLSDDEMEPLQDHRNSTKQAPSAKKAKSSKRSSSKRTKAKTSADNEPAPRRTRSTRSSTRSAGQTAPATMELDQAVPRTGRRTRSATMTAAKVRLS